MPVEGFYVQRLFIRDIDCPVLSKHYCRREKRLGGLYGGIERFYWAKCNRWFSSPAYEGVESRVNIAFLPFVITLLNCTLRASNLRNIVSKSAERGK